MSAGTLDPERLREALAAVRTRLDEAAARSGRAPGAVEVVLAGKYVAADDVPALVAAGVGVVGENRLQDLAAKAEQADGALAFDFIGHLQRRKVRDVLPMVRLVHSLDSAPLAAEIASRAGGPVRVLVEVNAGEEPTKHGILPARVRGFVEEVSAHADLVLGGLMVMPPLQTDPEGSRPHFAAARALAEGLRAEWAGRHDFAELSMGTSQDYAVAAEEGATIVRVGRGVIDGCRRR
jgi:pyridoxal phosphate enzyme (YggS family)